MPALPASGASLARRPREVATAEDVDVYVEDRLARARAGVDDGAVAFVGVARVACDARGDAQEVAERGLVGLFRLVERGDLRAREDERERRGLRVDVAEGDGALVLVNLRRGNLPRDDLAEDAVLSGRHKIFRLINADVFGPVEFFDLLAQTLLRG